MNTQLGCSAYGLICACAVDGRAKRFGMLYGTLKSLHIFSVPTGIRDQMLCIKDDRTNNVNA